MNSTLFRFATAPAGPTAARVGPAASRREWRLSLAQRRAAVDYVKVLSGASGRLALQTLYFLVLANTLNLRDMGIFASISAAGMILGCFTGLGFQGILFRAAASRPRLLGGVFAAYYAAFAASLPIGFAAAGGLYWLLFAYSISAFAFFTIIAVEIGLWRFVEMLAQVNNGLGRFGAAAHVLMGSAGLRALAALAFLAAGGGDATRWSAFYFAGNAAAFVALGYLYHPRVRPRWKPTIFLARWRDALWYAFSYFTFLAQTEVDKLVILSLSGERMAGVYVIAMRIVDLTAAPLRPLFVLYSRKLLLAGRARVALLAEIVQVEALVAVVSIALFAALLAVLGHWPNALGHNVASAYGLLSLLLIVPAAKNGIEFHGELFFAFDRIGAGAAFAAAMVALKAVAIALLIHVFAGAPAWGAWLNPIYFALYFASLVMVRAMLTRQGA